MQHKDKIEKAYENLRKSLHTYRFLFYKKQKMILKNIHILTSGIGIHNFSILFIEVRGIKREKERKRLIIWLLYIDKIYL